MKKTNPNFSKSWIKFWVFPALIIPAFLLYGVASAVNSGSGPFASFLLKPGVNILVIDDSDDQTVTQTPGQAKNGTVTVTNKKNGKRKTVKNATIPIKPAAPPTGDQSSGNTGACSSKQLGQFRCNSNKLEVCVGTSWQLSQTCVTGCANNSCNPPITAPLIPENRADNSQSCAPKGWWNENDNKCYYPGETHSGGYKICSGEAPGAKYPYAYNALSCPEDKQPAAPPVNNQNQPPEDKPPIALNPPGSSGLSAYDCIQMSGTWHNSTSTCLLPPKEPLTCKFSAKCSGDSKQTCTINPTTGSLKFTSAPCEFGCDPLNVSCKPAPRIVSQEDNPAVNNSSAEIPITKCSNEENIACAKSNRICTVNLLTKKAYCANNMTGILNNGETGQNPDTANSLSTTIISAAQEHMNNCVVGAYGAYNACIGEYYHGEILDPNDTINPIFGTPPRDPTDLYWCTDLIYDSAEAAGIDFEYKIPGALNMYGDYVEKDAVTLTENAVYSGNSSNIQPGMVAFVSKPSFTGSDNYSVAHVTLVTDVTVVGSTTYVTVIQANSGSVEETYQLDDKGRLVTEVNGTPYYIRGFGDIEEYAENL